MKQKLLHSLLAACALAVAANAQAQTLKLNNLDYFEARGTNVLVYSNLYDGGFCDEKLAGIEISTVGAEMLTVTGSVTRVSMSFATTVNVWVLLPL